MGEYPQFGVGLWPARWVGEKVWYAYRIDGPDAMKRCGHGHKTLSAAASCLVKVKMPGWSPKKTFRRADP